jgi:hypothetical protein
MNKIHGVLSIILFFISIVIGLIAISFTSITHVIIYAGILPVAFGCVIYFYCGKCTCRSDFCGHIIPGKLTKLFPDRPPGAYSTLDFFITSVAMALITLYPQYWLWKFKLLFLICWILVIVGLVDIFLFVCKECKNEHCPMCPDFK